MRIHSDERRTAYCDLFESTPGDVNLFVIKPGQRTCWHRHEHQADQFRVLRGTVLFKKFCNKYSLSNTISDPMQVFEVRPGDWHGYENVGDEDAYLLMYLDRPYDPTDEEKMGEDKQPWKSP